MPSANRGRHPPSHAETRKANHAEPSVETHSCVSPSRQATPRRKRQTMRNPPVETHSCVSASRQATPRRERQTTRNPPVETHSCVSASRQAFATGDFIRQSRVPRRENASLQLFAELTDIPRTAPMTGDAARHVSTNQTTPRRKRQTRKNPVETHSCVSPSRQATPRRKRQTRKNPVETHSCVSASRQAFATGDFIRQSRVPRRENASLQLFAELTDIPRTAPMTGDAARHVSTNQTTPRRERQTTRNPPVETHSCVSASRQVFATGDFIRQSRVPRRKNASLQLFAELTDIPRTAPMTGDAARHVSTNQTTPRRKRQTRKNPVETHSCVSPSRQVFATGDFIRQSRVPRRKNASLQLFAELTDIPRTAPMTGDAGNISASAAL